MLQILEAVLQFEDLRASVIDWVLSAELFYQHNMILKVTDILSDKIADGTLVQSQIITDPAIMRLLQATQFDS